MGGEETRHTVHPQTYHSSTIQILSILQDLILVLTYPLHQHKNLYLFHPVTGCFPGLTDKRFVEKRCIRRDNRPTRLNKPTFKCDPLRKTHPNSSSSAKRSSGKNGGHKMADCRKRVLKIPALYFPGRYFQLRRANPSTKSNKAPHLSKAFACAKQPETPG